MIPESEISALKNAVYTAQAVAVESLSNQVIASTHIGAYLIYDKPALLAAIKNADWASVINNPQKDTVIQILELIDALYKKNAVVPTSIRNPNRPAKTWSNEMPNLATIPGMVGAAQVAIAPFVKAVNAYNTAIATNQAEADAIAKLKKEAEQFASSDEAVSALLQMEYLRLYETPVYDKVLDTIAAKTGKGELNGLGGLGSKLKKALKVVFPVAAISTGAAVAAGEAAVSAIKAAPSWATAIFPVHVLADSLNKAVSGGLEFAYKDNRDAIQAVVKYSPLVLLNRAIVPEETYQKAKAFEQKYRDEIKIAGAVVATVVGLQNVAPNMLFDAVAGVEGLVGAGVAGSKAVASTAAATLAKELGIESAKGVTATAVIEAAKAQIPDAAKIGEMLGDKMADYVKKAGTEKVQAIAQKYLAGGAITDPNDPRLAAMQAEIVAAANGGMSPNVDVLTATAKNGQGPDLKSWIIPGVAIATFLFK